MPKAMHEFGPVPNPCIIKHISDIIDIGQITHKCAYEDIMRFRGQLFYERLWYYYMFFVQNV